MYLNKFLYPSRTHALHLAQVFALLYFLPPYLNAQITFTIEATVNPDSSGTEGALGYSTGDPVVIQFTTGVQFGENSSSNFTVTSVPALKENSWIETSSAEDQLFVTVSGTGLSGSYIRPEQSMPNFGSGSAEISVREYPDGSNTNAGTTYSGLYLNAAGGYGGSTGLTTSNSTTVESIQVALFGIGQGFSYTSGYSDPVDYFSNHYGTYTPEDGSYIVISAPLFITAVLTPSSLTISPLTAVPEPSTATLSLGLICGIYALGRRQRRQYVSPKSK